VRVDGGTVARTGPGLLILLAVLRGDDEATARRFAGRLARWRCFPDAEGRMNRALLDLGLEALVVSQFTLAADGGKGRRPSFDAAAPPEPARALYGVFVEELRALGVRVATGVFQAHMEVELVNDGPVTFALEETPGPRGHPPGGPAPPSQVLA